MARRFFNGYLGDDNNVPITWKEVLTFLDRTQKRTTVEFYPTKVINSWHYLSDDPNLLSNMTKSSSANDLTPPYQTKFACTNNNNPNGIKVHESGATYYIINPTSKSDYAKIGKNILVFRSTIDVSLTVAPGVSKSSSNQYTFNVKSFNFVKENLKALFTNNDYTAKTSYAKKYNIDSFIDKLSNCVYDNFLKLKDLYNPNVQQTSLQPIIQGLIQQNASTKPTFFNVNLGLIGTATVSSIPKDYLKFDNYELGITNFQPIGQEILVFIQGNNGYQNYGSSPINEMSYYFPISVLAFNLQTGECSDFIERGGIKIDKRIISISKVTKDMLQLKTACKDLTASPNKRIKKGEKVKIRFGLEFNATYVNQVIYKDKALDFSKKQGMALIEIPEESFDIKQSEAIYNQTFIRLYLEKKNADGEFYKYNIIGLQEDASGNPYIDVIIDCIYFIIKDYDYEVEPIPQIQITSADFQVGCQYLTKLTEETSKINIFAKASANAQKVLTGSTNAPEISYSNANGDQVSAPIFEGTFSRDLTVNNKIWMALPDKRITIRIDKMAAKMANINVVGASESQVEPNFWFFTYPLDNCGVTYSEPKQFVSPPPPSGTKINCSDLLNPVQCIEISKDGNKKGDKVKLAAYVTLTPLGEQLLHNFNEVLNPSQLGPNAQSITEKKLPLPITKAGQMLGYGYIVFAEFKIGDVLPKNAYVNAIFKAPDPNYQSFKYDLSALQGPVKSASYPNDVFYFCSISLDCLEKLASEYKEEATPPPSISDRKLTLYSFCKYVKTTNGENEFQVYSYFKDEDLPYVSHIIFPTTGERVNKNEFKKFVDPYENKEVTGFILPKTYKSKTAEYDVVKNVAIYLDAQYADKYKFYTAKKKDDTNDYYKLSADKKYLVSPTIVIRIKCKLKATAPKKAEKQISLKGGCLYVTKNPDGSVKFKYYNYFENEELQYISHVVLFGIGPNKGDVKIEKSKFEPIKLKDGKTYQGFITEYNHKFSKSTATSMIPNTAINVYLYPNDKYKFFYAQNKKKIYFEPSSDKQYLIGSFHRGSKCIIGKEPVVKPPEQITQPCPPCPEMPSGKKLPVDVVPSNISPIQVPIQFKPDGGAMEIPVKFKPMSISELPVSPMDTVKQTPTCIIVIKKHQGTYRLPPNCPFDRRRNCFHIPGNRALYAKPERKRKHMPDININVIANTGDMRKKYDKKPYFNINSQNRRDASRYAPYYNQPQYDKYGRRQHPLTIRDREGRQLPSASSLPEGIRAISETQKIETTQTPTQPQTQKKSNKGFWILIAIVGVVAAGAFSDGNLFEDFTKTIGKAKKSKW